MEESGSGHSNNTKGGGKELGRKGRKQKKYQKRGLDWKRKGWGRGFERTCDHDTEFKNKPKISFVRSHIKLSE